MKTGKEGSTGCPNVGSGPGNSGKVEEGESLGGSTGKCSSRGKKVGTEGIGALRKKKRIGDF